MGNTDPQILELLEEGLFLFGVGKAAEAVEMWRKVLELDPGNQRAIEYIESAGESSGDPTPDPDLPPPPGGSDETVLPPPPGVPSTGSSEALTAERGGVPPPSFSAEGGAASSPGMPGSADVLPPPPMGPPPGAPGRGAQAESVENFPPPTGIGSAAPPQTPPAVRADSKEAILEAVAALYKEGKLDEAYDRLKEYREGIEEDPVVDEHLDRLRSELLERYNDILGSIERVPQVAVSKEDLMSRQLSPEEGYVLSRVDGSGTAEDLLTLLGVDRFTGLRALCHLYERGLIIFI